MDAKLTLSIKPEIIEKVKALVKQEGTSLSAEVEKYFLWKIKQAGMRENPLEKIRSLMKDAPVLSDEEIKQRIHEHRMSKYGGA
jgi:hypothetical protein